MSRHSNSSEKKHGRSAGTSNSEELIEYSKYLVDQLNTVVHDNPSDWETHLDSARSVIATLENIRFFRGSSRFVEQVWLLNGLQDFSFHDPDSGFIQDIADWCRSAWLQILRNYPDNTEVLAGLGRNWLQRAQATLIRIDALEDDQAASNSAPSDPRRQAPLYVEARGILQPAIDFYSRAVRVADADGTTNGNLLASAAEAQIALGSVTASPNDERHFSYAIRYLRRAEGLPGFSLSGHLQDFLREHGRYVS